jgi:parallel beta-helix repeat protein
VARSPLKLPCRVVATALTIALALDAFGGFGGRQVALAIDPSPAPISSPSTAPVRPDEVRPDAVRPDPAVALEQLQSARIRAMALTAARRTRSLQTAHVPQKAIKAMRAVFRNEASVVLLARRAPYTLRELGTAFPAALSVGRAGDWTLREHIVVGAGARLMIVGPEVRSLRLLSTTSGFVTIAGWNATIELRGTVGGVLRIASWDPTTDGPDTDRTDGRAYIIAKGGRLDVADAQLGGLGFTIGESSGVAWRGWPGRPVRGSALRSRFVSNFFGAYTFEAVDMSWIGNAFVGNVVYGFDPHDHSVRFTVTSNMAIGNGSHGMIFSRGCSGNVIRANTSAINGGNGFVLDDGRVASDGDPRHIRPEPSNDNVIEGNVAWGDAVGIALEGASRNVVRGNLLAGNRFGLRLKDASSSNILAGNIVGESSIFGVEMYAISSPAARPASSSKVRPGIASSTTQSPRSPGAGSSSPGLCRRRR